TSTRRESGWPTAPGSTAASTWDHRRRAARRSSRWRTSTPGPTSLARRRTIDGNTPASRRDERPARPGTSVLGATLVMRGELTLAEDLIVEGRFEGRITQGNHRLSIGEQARVRADIDTGSAVIAGSVEGDVRGLGTIVVTR